MRPNDLAQTLAALLKTKRPVYVWGPPGIGKSSIVKQAAKANNFDLVDVRATLLDPVDLRGIPSISNGQTKWCPPEFLPTGGQGVLFLDELAQAPPLVQSACMQLVLDRQLGEYRLPDGWTVVAASNRQEDRAGTHRLITPLLNRLIHVDVEVSTEDWQEWAVANEVAPEVTSFIKFRPGLLFNFDPSKNERAFATPRSWQFVSDILNTTPPNTLNDVVRGCVGDGPGTEFASFLTMYRQLPDLDVVLANPTNAAVPKEPAVRYALVGALVDKVRNDRSKAAAVVKYAARFPDEFGMLTLRDLIAVDPTLASAPGVQGWVADARKKGLFAKL